MQRSRLAAVSKKLSLSCPQGEKSRKGVKGEREFLLTCLEATVIALGRKVQTVNTSTTHERLTYSGH